MSWLSRERAAMTLLETLLALALSSLLLTGIAMLIGVTARDSAAAQSHDDTADPIWFEAFVRQLRCDLRKSHRVVIDPDRLVLEGNTAIAHPGGGTLNHDPVRVSYRIQQIQGGSWLVRQQTALKGDTQKSSRIDGVVADARAFSILPPGSESDTHGAAVSTLRFAETRTEATASATPNRFVLSLTVGVDETTTMERQIVLR